MSVKVNRCPKCGDTRAEVIKTLDPEVSLLNKLVILHCLGCGHDWEARLTRVRREGKYL